MHTIRVSNDLYPDQDQPCVGPDQGPSCLQRLSADGKSRKERVPNTNIYESNIMILFITVDLQETT